MRATLFLGVLGHRDSFKPKSVMVNSQTARSEATSANWREQHGSPHSGGHGGCSKGEKPMRSRGAGRALLASWAGCEPRPSGRSRMRESRPVLRNKDLSGRRFEETRVAFRYLCTRVSVSRNWSHSVEQGDSNKGNRERPEAALGPNCRTDAVRKTPW